MKQMLTRERRNEIAEKLNAVGQVSAADLAREYGVSSETIRKDLLWLEERGLAEKSYGGAVAASRTLERPFLEKASYNPEQKKRIAHAIAGMIPSGAAVILDSGSTLSAVAQALASRSDLILFTNSLQAAQILAARKRQVCMIGGMVRLSSQAATGYEAEEALSRIHADVAILGASGFADCDGPCVESMEECGVKRAMIRSARTVIVAADSTKARCRARYQFAKWREVSRLVTDSGLQDAALHSLQAQTEVQCI